MKEKIIIAGGLFLLIVLNAVSVLNWVKKDTRPTAYDESIHTLVAFDYKERAASGDMASLLQPAYFNYPPLYHYFVAAALGRAPDVADTGALVNIVGGTLLIALIFLLGWELLGLWEGLVAAILFTSYAVIRVMHYITMIDLWLTVWVALGLYTLIKSDAFENWLWSAAFGFSFACGLLTKWTAPAYLLFPLAPALFVAFRQKRWGGVGLFVVMAVAIAGPWYAINALPAFKHVSGYAAQVPAGGVVWSGWKNTLWYAAALYWQTGFLSFLLLPGLIAVFWRPRLLPLFLGVLGTYFFFSLIRNRSDRYFMPILPAVALLSVGWLPSQRRWPHLCVVGLVVVSFFFVHHDLPKVQDWKHAEVIETVQRLKKDPSRLSRVVVVSTAAFFHSNSFNVDLKARGIKKIDFKGVPKRRWFEFAEFVLTKTGDVGPAHSVGSIEAPVRFMQNPAPWFSDVYREKATWSLPDGSTATLYQQEPRAHALGEMGLFNLTLSEMKMPNIAAQDVEIRAVPESKEKTAVGAFRELSIRCGSLLYKGVELKNVSLRLIQPQVNLPLFLETQEIQLLSLERLKPSAELNKNAVLELVKTRAKWLRGPILGLENGVLTIGGKAFGVVPLRIAVKAEVEGTTFRTKIQRVTVAGLPFPALPFRAIIDRVVSLSPNPEMLYYFDIGNVQEENEMLKITAS